MLLEQQEEHESIESIISTSSHSFLNWFVFTDGDLISWNSHFHWCHNNYWTGCDGIVE